MTQQDFYNFGDDGSRRVANATRQVEGRRRSTRPGELPPPPAVSERVRVKVIATEEGAGQFEVELVEAPDADFDPAADLTLAMLGEVHTNTPGARVMAICLHDADRGTWSLEVGRIYSGDIIRVQEDQQAVVAVDGPDVSPFVLVKNDGGAAGSDGVAATFTYSIHPLSDTDLVYPIAEGVEVVSRLIPAEMTAAPDGSPAMAVKLGETWKIISGTIAEVLVTAGCDGEGE